MAEVVTVQGQSRLLVSLAAADAAHRVERKRLVCRRRGEGRELLRALASAGVHWIGWEVETVWSLAHDLAAATLAERAVKLADEFDQLGLLDESLDEALAHEVGRPWRAMGEGAGLRRAVVEAVRALRLAGVPPAAVSEARLRDGQKAALLQATLRNYEARLEERAAVDAADVYRLALDALEGGAALGPVFLLPGHERDGLAGRLLERMVESGAAVLDSDPVIGLERPESWLPGPAGAEPASALSWLHRVERAPSPATVELFAATSPADELREVLRRVMRRGLRWDEVEIVATDPTAYGVALDGLARRLGIPVTHAVGLPIQRTRPGRALHLYLRWVEDGFPADLLWGLLERGDLAPAAEDAPGPGDLARRLREMRIGRGRARTLSALADAERRTRGSGPREGERDPDVAEQRRMRERSEVAALVEVLRPLLEATPALPEDGGATEPRTSPGALAHGAAVLLAGVPVRSEVDATARKRLLARLGKLSETAVRETPLTGAIGWLRERTSMRVPAPDREGAAPWVSAGSHLHVSDVEHGGLSGRRATFVVGLDSSRFPGTGLEHALLTDDDRWRLSGPEFGTRASTAADRVHERRWALAAMLARLRGEVTLSYADWEAADGRSLAPAPEMLQALRLREGRPDLDYGALRKLIPRASAIPVTARLDAADVWLGTIAHEGVLRRAVDLVRALYPGLDRGLRAAEQRDSAYATPHDGFIGARPALDLTRGDGMVLSASRLETLGRCPHRFLLGSILKVYPPGDPDVRSDAWLSPLDRGNLLHAVYESALRLARARDVSYTDPPFEALALELLEHEIVAWRKLVPVPGEALFEREADGLRRDIQSFVRLIRQHEPDWVELERAFGLDGEDPIALPVGDGVLRVRGRIDRIDRRGAELVVVDYKTGSTRDWGRASGTFARGRRLQHALYAAVAERIYEQPVAGVEYHFATQRAMNQCIPFTRAELARGFELIERLVNGVAEGRFPPTEDPADCRFCDYADVCRVYEEYGESKSPRARWSYDNLGRLEELAGLRDVRRFEH